jgi:hypothetical protein
MNTKFIACSIAFVAAHAVATAQQATLRPVSEFASISDPKARTAALFTEAGKVLQHPRCVNCHPRTDQPLQGDRMQVHQPPVTRGGGGVGAVGMQCPTCHNSKNFDAGGVPGHESWHLAPIEMAWEGRSLREICLQLKDRKRNGGKSIKQIVEHMAHDSLVGWGWQPDAGRTPAPGTQKQFGELMQAWMDAGAHCPS